MLQHLSVINQSHARSRERGTGNSFAVGRQQLFIPSARIRPFGVPVPRFLPPQSWAQASAFPGCASRSAVSGGRCRATPVSKGRISGTDPSNPGPLCCIQSHVTGTGLIKRVFVVIAIAAGLLTFVGATAHASPIRPDIRKLLAQPTTPTPQYIPARAGWNGPEISTARTAPNPTYESLSPATAAREVRASLTATMVPDYRVLVLLALVILLLRRMRKQQPIAASAGSSASSVPVAALSAIPVAPAETQTEESAA
jgi:hypothetical protein